MPDEPLILRLRARKDFRRLAITLILQKIVLTCTAYGIQSALIVYWQTQAPHSTWDEIYDRLWNSGLDMIAASLLGLAVVLLLLGSRLRRAAPGERIRPRQFLLALIGINGLQLLATLISVPLNQMVEQMGYSLEEASAAATGASVTVSMLLYAVLIAPLVEELIFRGAVLRWLEPWGRRFALVTSSILFGLMHANLVQLPTAIICGLLFGYIAQRFSLRAAFMAHAANNLFAELVSLVPDEYDIIWMLYFFIKLLCAAYVIYWCLTRRKSLFNTYAQAEPRIVKWFLTSIPMLILLITYIVQTLESAIPV